MMIQRIKGTHDSLDLTVFDWAIRRLSCHALLYNFSPIMTPILEPLSLFQRTVGLETDLVNKEMFLIQMRDQQSEQICLRPEATAPIARAFVENTVTQIPWKVFSHGPMFRYERPQKGRYRQFYQFSYEIIGSSSSIQDAQLIMMLDRLFSETLLLDTYALKINFLGTRDDQRNYASVLISFLESKQAQGMCDTCIRRRTSNVMRIFDCKNQTCQDLYRSAPNIVDYLCKESQIEWDQLTKQLDLLSVSFSYCPTLVRGLDYYTKTVFEFVSHDLGAQSAFCAGGRYDNLVQELSKGKDHQPSVGASIGVDRLLLLLEPIKDRLLLDQLPPLYVIIPLSEQQQMLAVLVADHLRAHNLCVDVLLEGGSVKSMMRKANKMGASHAILLGETEQNNKEATVKNMMTGSEERISQVELVSYLK